MGNQHGVPKLKDVLKDVTENRTLDLRHRRIRRLPAPLIHKLILIQKIDISNNDLKELPAEIGLLVDLVELRMRQNDLSRLPPQFKALLKLRVLDLSQNFIKIPPMDIISQFTQLQSLNLDRNGIATLSTEISHLTNLRFLSLRGNNLERLPDLSALACLSVLDVSNNRLVELPHTISSMAALSVLSLGANDLTRLPPLHALINLTHMDLSYNRLTKLPDELAYLAPAAAWPISVEPRRSINASNRSSSWGIVSVSSSEDTGVGDGGVACEGVDEGRARHAENPPVGASDLPKSCGRLLELNVRENREMFSLPKALLELREPFQMFSSVPSEILPNLYLSGVDAASNLNLLEFLNITHVVLAIGDSEPCFPERFKYHVLADARDTPSYDMSVHFEACTRFINTGRAAGGVLVHCRAGVSRSATLTIAYLMHSQRMPYLQAYQHVHRRRPQVQPNSGFREQLIRYEVALSDVLVTPPIGKGNPQLNIPVATSA